MYKVDAKARTNDRLGIQAVGDAQPRAEVVVVGAVDSIAEPAIPHDRDGVGQSKWRIALVRVSFARPHPYREVRVGPAKVDV